MRKAKKTPNTFTFNTVRINHHSNEFVLKLKDKL